MSNSNSLNGTKRRRSSDGDEAYFDNYHTHKRFLTEVMACSMNGLSVSDANPVSKAPSSPLPDPAASVAETLCTVSRSASPFPGDEISTLDSPMSEDSDDSVGFRYTRGTEGPVYPAAETSEFTSSHPLSCSFPNSPRRGLQKPPCSSSTPGQPPVPGPPLPWVSSNRMPATPPWPRFPETEGRLPPSPNDSCQAPDLRRAALLRNLSMRNQLPAQLSPSSAPDGSTGKVFQDKECCCEEAGEQMSVNALFYDFTTEQVGCSTSIMGSPTHGLFPIQVMRGSSRVRSLILGENTVRSKAFLNNEASKSVSKGDGMMVKVDKSTRFEEEFSCSNRSPKSPSGAASSSYEKSSSLSPKDGSASDAESSFDQRFSLAKLYAC